MSKYKKTRIMRGHIIELYNDHTIEEMINIISMRIDRQITESCLKYHIAILQKEGVIHKKRFNPEIDSHVIELFSNHDAKEMVEIISERTGKDITIGKLRHCITTLQQKGAIGRKKKVKSAQRDLRGSKLLSAHWGVAI